MQNPDSEKDVERQLTQEWEDTARQAQSSMERLGRLADHFRRAGWAQCARELEEALTTIQHEATREVRASMSDVVIQRELNRVLNALALELPPSVHADATARIHALFDQRGQRTTAPFGDDVVYQGSVVLHRLELRGTLEQIETLVAQKCENLKRTIMDLVRAVL